MEFKLWKLPDLPRARIIRQISPVDVFQLTLMSEPFERFMKANKISATSLTWKSKDRDYNNWVDHKGHHKWIEPTHSIKMKIQFPAPFNKLMYFQFSVKVKEDSEDSEDDTEDEEDEEDEEDDTEEKVDRIDWTIRRDGRKTITVCDIEDETEELKAVEEMYERVKNVFHIQNFCLEHSDNYGNCVNGLSDFFAFKIVDKFSLIKINGMADPPYGDCAVEDFLFFMNEVKTDKLCLSVECDSWSRKDLAILDNIVLKQPHVEVKGHDWLTIEHILSSECKILKCGEVRGIRRAEDIVNILKAWSKGTKLTKIKKLTFHLPYHVSCNEVLELLDKADFVLDDEYKKEDKVAEEVNVAENIKVADEDEDSDGSDDSRHSESSDEDEDSDDSQNEKKWDRKIRRETDGKMAAFYIERFRVRLYVL